MRQLLEKKRENDKPYSFKHCNPLAASKNHKQRNDRDQLLNSSSGPYLLIIGTGCCNCQHIAGFFACQITVNR